MELNMGKDSIDIQEFAKAWGKHVAQEKRAIYMMAYHVFESLIPDLEG